MLLTTPKSKDKVLEVLPDDKLVLHNNESGRAYDHMKRIREYVSSRSYGYIIINDIEKAENFDDMMIFLSQTDEIPEIEVNDKKKSLNKFLYLFLYTDESYDEYDDIDFSYSEIKDKLLIPNWETKTSSRFNHRAFFNRLNIQILSSNDEFTFEPLTNSNNYRIFYEDNMIVSSIVVGFITIISVISYYYVMKRNNKDSSVDKRHVNEMKKIEEGKEIKKSEERIDSDSNKEINKDKDENKESANSIEEGNKMKKGEEGYKEKCESNKEKVNKIKSNNEGKENLNIELEEIMKVIINEVIGKIINEFKKVGDKVT